MENHLQSLVQRENGGIESLTLTKNHISFCEKKFQVKRNKTIERVGSIKLLKKVSISDCAVKSIPQSLLRLDLFSLDLSRNFLADIPVLLSSQTQITDLDLSNNKLEVLPNAVCNLENLRFLNLSHNCIQCIPTCISNLKCLEVLNLQHNKQRELCQELCSVVSLKTLNASENFIEHVTPQLEKLGALMVFNLRKNNLTHFPEDVFKLPRLHDLNVAENFIKQIPTNTVPSKSLEILDLQYNSLTEFPSLASMERLKSVNLRGNCIQSLPGGMTKLPQLHELNLESNLLETIPEVLCQQQMLKVLNLSNNCIKDFPPQIKSLKNLEELDVQGNIIDLYPENINLLPHLKKLHFDTNNIRDIPESIKKLTELESLSLSNNLLAEFPTFVCHVKSLRTLNLGRNSFCRIPEELLGLKCLEVLDLQGNCIESFPEHQTGDDPTRDTTCLNQLQEIDLSSNRLVSFPESVIQLKQLTRLNLNDNKIHTIPHSIQGLNNLRELFLCENGLKSMPGPVCQLKNLKILKLDDNVIDAVPSIICEMTNLEQLSLSSNTLENFPETVNSVQNLKVLNLDSNKIHTVPESVKKLESLVELNVSKNFLEEFPIGLTNVASMKVLKVAHNRIANIPSSVHKLMNLELLDLENCSLKAFPTAVGRLCNLTELNLKDNAVESIPEHISKCTLLESLNMCSCSLREFPQHVASLGKLKKLSLNKNPIQSIPDIITKLYMVEDLNLGDCMLHEFPGFVLDLPRLRVLNMCGNPVLSMENQDWASKMTLLEELNLRNCKLTQFPGIVKSLSRLKKFSIYGNQVGLIPRSITALTRLEDFSIGECKLEKFPDCITDLSRLKKLSLWSNEIKYIPSHITLPILLEDFNIGRCKLDTFPECITYLPKLKILSLYDNNVQTVPCRTAYLAMLKELNFGMCKLEDIPDCVMSLTRLKKLSVYGNRIRNIPDDFAQMTMLEDLNLGSCCLDELSEAVTKLLKLKKLSMWKNEIKSIPSSMKNLVILEHLNLGCCGLNEFPQNLAGLSKLKKLSLYGNPINTIPKRDLQCGMLEDLNVGLCKLDQFPLCITHLPKLKKLAMQDNVIYSVPASITQLILLQELSLNKCCLEEFPLCITKLPKLKEVKMMYNQIKSIPLAVADTHILDVIYMSGNPLQQPPYSVWEKGTDKVRRYFRELKAYSAINSFHMRVILIGDPCAGKTSLMNTLVLGQPQMTLPHDRTVVLDEQIWEINCDHQCHFTDFGGHKIYHMIYPLFIASNTMVILVLDLSLPEETLRHSFLSHLQSPVPQQSGIRLLIVGTHGDMITAEDLKLKQSFIRSTLEAHCRDQIKYIDMIIERNMSYSPYVDESNTSHLSEEKKFYEELLNNCSINILCTSSKHMLGISEVRNQIGQALTEKKMVLPTTWHKTLKEVLNMLQEKKIVLKSELESLQQPQLACDHSTEMPLYESAKRRKLEEKQTVSDDNEEQMELVLTILNSSGLALYFASEGLLVSTDFLIRVLKNIFDHNYSRIVEFSAVHSHIYEGKTDFESDTKAFVENGILSSSLLRMLLSEFKLNEEICNTIVTLLAGYKIWYQGCTDRNPSGGNFHLYLPWMVKDKLEPGGESCYEEQYEHVVKEHIVFGFWQLLPQSLFERVSVSLLSHFPPAHCFRRDWCNGIFAKRNRVSILIKTEDLDQSENECHLHVQLRAPVRDLTDLWDLGLGVIKDIQNLLKEVPHIVSDQYLECAHCQLVSQEVPRKIPLSSIKSPQSHIRWLSCDQGANGHEFPAGLVYPVHKGDDDYQNRVEDVCMFVSELHQSQHSNQVSSSGTESGSIPTALQRNSAKYEPTILNIIVKDVNVKEPTIQVLLGNKQHVYCMERHPRGRAIIINMESFKNRDHDRNGAQYDALNLSQLFDKLYFKSVIWENYSKEKLLSRLEKEHQDKDFHHNADAFILVIMSHGVQDGFYTSDEEVVTIDSVIKYFDAKNCPELIGKPKLFFVQACQVPKKKPEKHATEMKEASMTEQTEKHTEVQSGNERADVFIAHATSPGCIAWRDAHIGSWFMRDLVEEFNESAHLHHLADIMTRVRKRMSSRQTSRGFQQISPVTNYLLKNLYFFPGYHK